MSPPPLHSRSQAPAAVGAATAGMAAPRRNDAATRSMAEPTRVLALPAAVAIIVGIVIGAGIFKAPSLVAGMAGSSGWMFAAWVLGGLVSLVGALCYAELATSHPHAGGDYHFLQRAFGRGVAFLFAWARFSVITTGSIALLGFVFGDYLQQLWPLGEHGAALYAATAVAVLTLVNLRGLRSGAATQTWLTLLEVAGLLLIVVAGLWLWFGGPSPAVAAAATAPASSGPTLGAFGMAMVFVLLTYGGWNEAAYLSAELKEDPRHRGRAMVRALVWSITVITVLYLLVNLAYWQGLGLAGMAASEAIAADLLRVAFGETGATVIALMVAVAALTSINATMIVGARTLYALGRDWGVLRRLGDWDAQRGTPRTAMALQGAAALGLVGIGVASGGGFRAMVEFTAPVFWLFFLLSGVSLFVLRRREAARPRPFEVPLYPLLPALFVAVCAGMLWSSLSFVHGQALGGVNAAWIGVAVLASGGLLLWALPHLQRTRSTAR
jgi:basic amino acid/polyamine antiporter, APA family